MKKYKFTKEYLGISLILILSGILNFANIGIEGNGNGYYAAGVKSMTLNIKNFFFVSFDPGSFVTIDKPPLGFWIQAIFAKIFGFSGWSILLPQALAGVISVYLIYYLVKRAYGMAAGLISAVCLAITPVFVAASRNNTIDNLLVVTLLFACIMITFAAEKGRVKYLFISLILVGIGFNIKMLEAYMIGPAFYITYLLSSTISFKKRIGNLVIGTVILFAVSLSWALIVDLVPSQNRPFIGSSTNNSVLELIIGHNGLERLGLSGKSVRGGFGRDNDGNNRGMDEAHQNNDKGIHGVTPTIKNQKNGNMQSPNGTGQRGIQGSFGGQAQAGITRLFSKNSLSDQIVWFLPIALLGFVAGALKEKLRLKLDNKRKISLVLWFTWLAPEFIYFSYTTGLFHPYYLTMMAPPIAALTGIGVVAMWEFFKEGKCKSWLLPASLLAEGVTHLAMFSNFEANISGIVRNIIIASLILCFSASGMLIISNIITIIRRKKYTDLNSNKNVRIKKIVLGCGILGILTTPFLGASAAITHSVNSTIPCAGLELLSNNKIGGFSAGRNNSSSNSKLINFLINNRVDEKYILVVASSQSADNIIIQTGEPVMALGGFSGSDNIISLDQFKELVKNDEVRYVLTGGMGRGGSSEIMNWVTKNGTLVPQSQYKDVVQNSESKNSDENNNLKGQNMAGFGGNNSEQLYDLKGVADTLK
ncbi:dolichyl-phosphate-mannose--protein mannosyltransferase [Clostridium chromiireducens]|uniref:Dolichyl-phosphate-mannose--protein mannosyltransferase n=1 Tax=Clostridium chromiireducens TaxID=225345 RepID=A0A964RR12_9CLOT|nr:glycosyltransferase family 39 protein [Clostridium chromiireducens]MVX66043.1 dolichyl-phosphate-mannose--protein mannosyltransferase [Clostridium chromiireducens]